VQQYFLLLTSINLLLALFVGLVFLINAAANKQIKWDKLQLASFASLTILANG